MGTHKLTTFSQFNLTEQEQLAGTILTTDQKQYIQTQLGMIAEERLALVPDPNNYADFIQKEAFLKGQMEFARHMLDSSTASESQVVSAAQVDAGTL